MSIILFFIVLAILILSHEFGHFIVAKKSGIRVDEFGFGFPPRIFKFKKKETIYSINLFPIGGFVKIYGEEGQDKSDPRSFASKPAKIKALVISAGVLFNLLLAWFLITGGYIIGTPMSVSSVPPGAEIKDPKIFILQVQEGTSAELAGLKMGDQLIDFKSVKEVQDFINKNKGQKTDIRYQRGKDIFVVSVTPSANPEEGKGALGIAMDEIGIVKLPWHRSFWEGVKTTYELIITVATAIFYFFYDLIRGLAGIEQVIGPVGIVGTTGTVAKLGFSYLLNFIALLSINLAIINFIPFPALDGGRLLFLLIEKVKGSPLNPKFSNIAHSIGLIILLILMATITYKDILKLI